MDFQWRALLMHKGRHRRRRLKDIKINAIAFVDAGANKRDFAIFKKEKKMEDELLLNDTDTEGTPSDKVEEKVEEKEETPAEKVEKIRHGAILARIKSGIAGANAEDLKKADINAWIKMLQDILPFAKKLENEGGSVEEVSTDLMKNLIELENSDNVIIKSVVSILSSNLCAQTIESSIQLLEPLKVEKKDDSIFKNQDVKKAYEEFFKSLANFEKEKSEQDKEIIEKAGRRISIVNEAHTFSAFKAFINMIKNMLGEEGLKKAAEMLKEGPASDAKNKLKDDVKKMIMEDKENKLTDEEAGATAELILAEEGV